VTVATVDCPPAHVRLRPVPPLEPPYDDEAVPRLRLIASHVEDPLPFDVTNPAPVGRPLAPPAPPRQQLPDPRPWAARLVVAVLEALAGRRPVRQLVPWTDDAVYAQLSRTVRSQALTGSRPGVLRSLRISEPADGVIELCAVVVDADRSRAVAARLEGADGRWQCTALQLG
jgi:hypothetical protein